MATAHRVDAFRAARSRRTRWFFVLVLILRAATVHGQSLAAVARDTALPPAAAPAIGGSDLSEIRLLVGRSTVLDVTAPIARVSLSRPEIADALVTGGQQVLVHGKTPGTISMFVWDRIGSIKRYEVVVQRDLSQLSQQLRQLFPGEPIEVTSNGSDVVVSGLVSSKYVVDKAAEVAAGYVEKKENIVNLLQQREGVATNQVMLRVRFAEVSRSALQELGTSLFTGPTGYKDYIARTTTGQFPAPNYQDLSRTEVNGDVTNLDGKFTFSDFLNLFVLNTKYNVGTLIKALQTRGLFQSLAEPNLVAQNGREASFLAGGEYPYPAIQGAAGNLSVTIVFKEFGIRLSFTPTVLDGDTIHLKVKPEVSALDFTNAVTYQGFRIPALTTRRADTEVELQDGQTFAIAGLLNNTVTETMQKIPGIGDVPILGLLFKSRALQKQQTELVVMITPQILRRGSTGAAPQIPNVVTPYMPPPARTQPPPPPYSPQGGAAVPRTEAAQPASPVANEERPSGLQVAAPAPASARPLDEGEADRAQQPPALAAATPPTPTREERRAAERAEKQASAQREAAARQQEEKTRRQQAEARAAAERERAEAKRAAEQQQVEARRAAEQARVEAKRAAERAKADAASAERVRNQEERLEAERARQESEVARKLAEDERKRGKALAEAQARLKSAQALYDAEVQEIGSSR
jgi:pilus assembly protein CpaC